MKFRLMSSIATVVGSLALLVAFLKLMVGRRHRKKVANELRSASAPQGSRQMSRSIFWKDLTSNPADEGISGSDRTFVATSAEKRPAPPGSVYPFSATYRVLAAVPGYAPPNPASHLEFLIDGDGYVGALWLPGKTIT